MNLGNPDEITIREFGEEIIELVGNPKANLVYRPLPVDDPKQRQPDISRAREVLGWEPTVSRADGLKRTLAYFREVVTP